MKPGPARKWIIAGTVVIALAIFVIPGTAMPRVGLFSETDQPAGLNRLEIGFALCPTGLALTAGTDLYQDCHEFPDDVSIRLTGDGVDLTHEAVRDVAAFRALPSGPLRLEIDGLADGTLDVLACRAYSQDAAGTEIIASTVPEVAYGTEALTATIMAQRYLLYGWPDNRWLASPVDPTADEIADDPGLYATVIRCEWFLFPPGSIAERPGIVRTYTRIDTVGEPTIHVLGPGGPVDATEGSATGDGGTSAFELRSTLDGMTVTTGDSWIAHYLLPAGSWAVLDHMTGRQATVDVAPGQVTRVVSVIATNQPGDTVPETTPLP